MRIKESEMRIIKAVVVNDDTIQLNVLSGLLLKDGIEVTLFESAEDALLSMAQSKTPDIIITDIYMPGIDGWKFCRLLRSPEYKAFNQVPILVVSATFSGDETSGITADLGVNAFLPSPVDGKRFAEVVRILLEGKQPKEQLRVLIVEDSKTLVVQFKQIFEANSYLVDTAFTAQEAASAFDKTFYNVAIIDYCLPDGSGDTLLKNFQSNQPDCVCIMITSDPDPKLALSWLRQGAAAYLRKPFDLEYLVELCAKARRDRSLLQVEDLLKKRTRQLLETEVFYKSVLNDMVSFVGTLCPNGDIIFINNTPLIACGLELEDVIGKKIYDISWWSYSDESIKIVRRDIEQCASGKFILHDIQFQTKDGTLGWVEYSMHPVYDKHGVVKYLIAEGREITRRKNLEEALQISEDKLNAIFKAIPDPIVVYDNNEYPRYINHAFNQVFGLTLKELQERNFPFIPDDEKEKNYKKTIELYGDRKPVSLETKRLTKDGDILDFFINASLIERHKGKFVGIVAILTDVTEKKKLEAKFHQSQKMESIGILAGGIAHDFNNLLFPIMGYAEMTIETVPEGSIIKKNLNEILTASLRAKDLVQQILTFSRESSQGQKPLQIQCVVKEVLKLLRSSLPATIKICQNIEQDCGQVMADSTRIHQIVMNLCTNAYHTMEETGGTLEVNLSKIDLSPDDLTDLDITSGQYVCLKVADTGHGMEYDVLMKIFDPYFTTKKTGKGTGLGLAVTHGIVKSMGGDIRVESQPGKGTVFYIYLPLIKETFISEKTGVSEKLPTGTEHILIVDDEKTIVSMGKQILESFGYNVTSCTTSIEALDVFSAQPAEFDLVITDLTMPDMTGDKLAGELVKIRSDIPIILCTGFSENISKEKADAVGIKGFLLKPIVLKDLAEKIREVLDHTLQR